MGSSSIHFRCLSRRRRLSCCMVDYMPKQRHVSSSRHACLLARRNVEGVLQELVSASKPPTRQKMEWRAVTTTTLDASKLTKKYGRHTVLQSFSLNLKPGVIHGLLGPNGSGKTTTLHIITGIIKPSSGSVQITGVSIEKRSLVIIWDLHLTIWRYPCH